MGVVASGLTNWFYDGSPFKERFCVHNGVRFETHVDLVLSLPEARACRLRTLDKARAEARCPAGCCQRTAFIGQWTNVVQPRSRAFSRVTYRSYRHRVVKDPALLGVGWRQFGQAADLLPFGASPRIHFAVG